MASDASGFPAKQENSSFCRKMSRPAARAASKRVTYVPPEDDEPTPPGTTSLVIVESPAKAKTIGKYLGRGFRVKATVGHVRDLPEKKLGIDVENGFEAYYVVDADKKKKVSELKRALKQADELFLATDEDREGEAIAWHLVETIKPKVPVKRMVFHEITRPAIQAAVANPRDIDRDLVDAQEARRILDRLYGYEVSPVLWKKVMPRLSAGRVQSVATRIVVERERQRMAFRSAEYWDINALLAVQGMPKEGPRTFNATLIALDGDRIATGRDFEPTPGRVKPGAGVVHLDGDGADGRHPRELRCAPGDGGAGCAEGRGASGAERHVHVRHVQLRG